MVSSSAEPQGSAIGAASCLRIVVCQSVCLSVCTGLGDAHIRVAMLAQVGSSPVGHVKILACRGVLED